MKNLFGKHRFAANLGIQIVLFVVLLVALGAAGGSDLAEQARKLRGELARIHAPDLREERPPDLASVERAADLAGDLASAVDACERRIAYRIDPKRDAEAIPNRNALVQAIVAAGNELSSIDTGGPRVPLPPENLGFGSDIPDPAKEPAALVQLDVIVRVARLALEAGIVGFGPIDRKVAVPRMEPPYLVDTPVQFEVRGSPISIARFLQAVASSDPFLAIREAHQSSREGRDEVGLVIVVSAVRISQDPAAYAELGGGSNSGPAGSSRAGEFEDLFRRR